MTNTNLNDLGAPYLIIRLTCADTPMVVPEGTIKRISFGEDAVPSFHISNEQGTITIPEKAIRGISFCSNLFTSTEKGQEPWNG